MKVSTFLLTAILCMVVVAIKYTYGWLGVVVYLLLLAGAVFAKLVENAMAAQRAREAKGEGE